MVREKVKEDTLSIVIEAEQIATGICLWRKGHKKGRQIWLVRENRTIRVRDRWFYMDGGWKDLGGATFSDGLLKEQQAIKDAVAMLAVQHIDCDSKIVEMLER